MDQPGAEQIATSTGPRDNTTTRPRSRYPRWLIALVVIAIVFAVLYPAIKAARRNSGMAKCAANLSALGKTARFYQSEQAYLPPTAQALLPDYGPSLDWGHGVFRCPGAAVRGRACDYGWVSYTTDAARAWADENAATAVLAFDDPANHDGKAGNVLFVDGHVRQFGNGLRTMLGVFSAKCAQETGAAPVIVEPH